MKHILICISLLNFFVYSPYTVASRPDFLPTAEHSKVASYHQSIDELEKALDRLQNTPKTKTNLALIRLMKFHIERSKLFLEGGWFLRSAQSIQRAQYLLGRHEASI